MKYSSVFDWLSEEPFLKSIQPVVGIYHPIDKLNFTNSRNPFISGTFSTLSAASSRASVVNIFMVLSINCGNSFEAMLGAEFLCILLTEAHASTLIAIIITVRTRYDTPPSAFDTIPFSVPNSNQSPVFRNVALSGSCFASYI